MRRGRRRSECCNEGWPAFSPCAQDVICNYTLPQVLMCVICLGLLSGSLGCLVWYSPLQCYNISVLQYCDIVPYSVV